MCKTQAIAPPLAYRATPPKAEGVVVGMRQRRRWPLLVLCLASWCLTTLQAASPVVCSVDTDCGPREECIPARNSRLTATGKTCRCFHYTFAGGTEPRCLAYNWRTALTGFLAISTTIYLGLSHVQYLVAYREHMTDPPLRPGETKLVRAISLRTLFLALSSGAAFFGSMFCLSFAVSLFTPLSTNFWYHSPLSPLQIGSALHAFGAMASFLVVVGIWVRVAAKLYDPHGSTKKALYQLAFALDGSGIGLYLAAFSGVPASGVAVYYLLIGDWVRAYISVSIFIACGVILTSSAAKLMVMRNRYFNSWDTRASRFCRWLSMCRKGASSSAGAEGEGVEEGSGEKVEEGRRKGSRPLPPRSDSTRVDARRRALEGDVVVSVSAESFISHSLSGSTHLASTAEYMSNPGRDRLYSVSGEGKWEGKSSEGSWTGRSFENEASTAPTGMASDGPSNESVSEEPGPAQPDIEQGGNSSRDNVATIELRVRIIQWEAWTVGRRVMAYAAISIVLLIFAMPYGPWKDLYTLQMCSVFLGGTAQLVANLNCLCYISPTVRHNVRRWAASKNWLLVCIAWLMWRRQR